MSALAGFTGCGEETLSNGQQKVASEPTSNQIGLLGDSEYRAICYGGYRRKSRDNVPTVDQIKEDLKILSAMGVKFVRTYNTQQYAHASNLLAAIDELRKADDQFEMYVMLGAWIDCEGAWTDSPNHDKESHENNTAEIEAAVELANRYSDVVRVIAVGNEAMVHWAAAYYVRPAIILKWVNHLQQLKSSGDLPADVLITSSDNFASWGGEHADYHCEDLEKLIRAVDYVSMHTYPFHDTHYNSEFWSGDADQLDVPAIELATQAVVRAQNRAESQYRKTLAYVRSIDASTPLHIGETGWATHDNSLYGATGSQAADEFKAKLFHDSMRKWTEVNDISCFYFEAFDEPWKNSENPSDSENHFGQFAADGKAKYSMWGLVDSGAFQGLSRDGHSITKSWGGKEQALRAAVLSGPSAGSNEMPLP